MKQNDDSGRSEPPAHLDLTWFSIANMHYEIGGLGIVTDGYVTRIPRDAFFGGGGGLGYTNGRFTPDFATIQEVLDALGGPPAVSLLLTGHSHFDHSFDTAAWSTLTGSPIIGSRTTALQAIAQGVSTEKLTTVEGSERLRLSPFVTAYVVRWNHSGDPAVNPEQHNAVELESVPDATGGLRAGVAEDFPNGGGNRGFLFVVEGSEGPFSWFYQNSASPVDLHVPIVVDNIDHGAPIENLKTAMAEAGIESVDLWIATGGAAIAELVAPVLKPRAYLPVHWDGLWGEMKSGVTKQFSDPELEANLLDAGIELVIPHQYFDKWRLDHSGIRAIENGEVKRGFGFQS